MARERDAGERAAFRQTVAGLDPTTFVFLDETSTPTTLTPLRARAPRGQRAVGRVPRGRWHAVSLLATLTLAGMGPALALAGPVDRMVFETFVTEVLVPTLRPGQLIVLDNLSVHKSAPARAAIEAVGCQLLFLPRYSPDCNPIELAFAKLKQALRRAEARSFASVVAATGTAMATISPQDTCGFYQAAGYSLTGQLL